jgi:branched-chain amino acid transport system permease protein
MLAELTQHVANGLVIGGGYALMGIGLTLIFGIMRVVNFAHGEFYMLGAFLLLTLFSRVGVDFFVASLVAIVAVGVVGAIVERVVLRPLRNESIEIPMLAMVALSVILQNAAILVWDPSPKTIRHPFSPLPIVIGPIHVVAIRLFAGLTAIALIVAAHLFIRRSRLGKAMRATFQDAEMARLTGVDVERVYVATFSFGAALAGAAGVLLGSVFWVYPAMGDQAAMKSFAVVIMGGLGDFLGAIAGGLTLGIAESLGAAYVSSGYKDAIGFVVIILLLLLRPQGLFGRRERWR